MPKLAPCPFCQIAKGTADASIIYEDDLAMAIVPLHAPYPESAVVFPKTHIDHFTDLPDDLAMHIMTIGFDLAKRIKQRYQHERIGMGVHGYGVAHAHFNVFPQNHPHDIVLRKMLYVRDGEIRFGFKHLAVPSKEERDKIARTLQSCD